MPQSEDRVLPQTEGPPPRALMPRIASAALRLLEPVGIVIRPFVVVQEGVVAASIAVHPRFVGGFVDETDLPELVRRGSKNADVCRERLQRGQLCYAIKDGDRIVAKMWCDLDEINFVPMRRPLADNEAYLYAAFTDDAVRGQNLAPLMREHCYAALRARGRDVFWSYSDFFNAPARRFKEKLGAVETAMGIYVSLFGRLGRTFMLRHGPRRNSRMSRRR